MATGRAGSEKSTHRIRCGLTKDFRLEAKHAAAGDKLKVGPKPLPQWPGV